MTLILYQTEEGRIPFKDWLLHFQDKNVRKRIRSRIDRLILGNFGDVKLVGTAIWELRIHFGPGYRVYFGIDKKEIVLLLCGGDKSTQTQDILIAKTYWQDYSRRRT